MATKSLKKQAILDPAVVRIFIVLIVLASGFFVFRWQNSEECPEVDFTVAENDLTEGELVEFTCKVQNIKSIKWDFGDGTTEKTSMSPAHIYEEPGEYNVSLCVNGSCNAFKTIVIQPKIVETKTVVIPKFSCPTKVYVGEKVRFSCLNNDSRTYEWCFGDSKSVGSTKKNPVYIYNNTGKMKVTLVVNGENKYIASKEIFVMPKPAKKQAPAKVTPPPTPVAPPPAEPEPEPVVKEKPKPIPVISNEGFQKMILSYAKGNLDKAAFNPYLSDSPNKVIVEINSEIIRFSDFLRNIQGQDLTIKEFVTYREQDKRIARIKIKFKRFK